MRLRLLLIVLLAVAGLGADCDGGSGSSSSGPAASFAATSAGTQGGGRFEAPIPEPSAALVFGAGVLLAGLVIRRNR